VSLSRASTHPPDCLAEGFTHPPAEEIAKGNTNASIGDRISAGVDAIGNKADESKQCVSHRFLPRPSLPAYSSLISAATRRPRPTRRVHSTNRFSRFYTLSPIS
jgi:hypothetical protein